MSRIQFYFVTGLLCALLVAVFAAQNPEPVEISFFSWRFPGVPKVLVILASAAAGALLVLFLGFAGQFRRYLYTRRLEQEIESLKKELAAARQAGGQTPPEESVPQPLSVSKG